MHRKFLRDSLLCFIPVLLAAILVFRAYQKYEAGEGGFKLGIDLVGGTILIYEVDQERERQRREIAKGEDDRQSQGEKISERLAVAIKKRIDPDDTKAIIVRAAGDQRIEVVLPTGSHRKNAEGKKNVNVGEVEKIKALIEEVGSLEFRIVANEVDDSEAMKEVRLLFPDIESKDAKLVEIAWKTVTDPSKLTDDERKSIEEDPDTAQKLRSMTSSAVGGKLPRAPLAPDSVPWIVHGSKAQYAWVEIGPIERAGLGLLNKYEEMYATYEALPTDEKKKEFINKLPEKEQRLFSEGFWKVMAAARAKNGVVSHQRFLWYSRPCMNSTLTAAERQKRKYEYYVLTRISDRVNVDGDYVKISARAENDPQRFRPVIAFTFNSVGATQFHEVTKANLPDPDTKFKRALAIILNGMLISSPTIESAISDRGQISGDFDVDYVNLIVEQLRSGALPAVLKQKPVAENTIGPTLGADTISSGTKAIGAAYLSVLIFMLVYYRFAGMVACVALLANLLLTVGFMVAVDAAFTLPGLAGLVLMLGMAVDANILIYERLREERDRGANLQMAIRNAYDRAFGTIIDTHLTSIFTAIILYWRGNDQLRGFGISLAVGLVISLFTSLFMTHLLFDYWLKRNWLTKLRMFRFFTRPNIDFMKLRKIMFPITGALTVIGLGLFLFRGDKSLNVDFVGGTVYSGQLNQEVPFSTLSDRLSEKRQETVLKVAKVQKINEPGKDVYEIYYEGDKEPRRVELALGLPGQTQEEKDAALKLRASTLPDLSIEQNFIGGATGDNSRFFTIRTTEKEPELVQSSIDRLFREDNGKIMLAEIKLTVTKVGDDTWVLRFSDPVTGEARYASEAYIRTLLNREFRTVVPTALAAIEPYQLQPSDDKTKEKDGRFSEMTIQRTEEARQNLSAVLSPEAMSKILNDVAAKYTQPQPERLETFDPTLAGDTRNAAFGAILLSWLAILLYLWFRFGNWTFGLAAVLCLIHDLCFTIGAIAVCHYIHDTSIGRLLGLQDFKIDFAAVAALLTLVGYSVNEIIVNFARIREVRGKNPLLTPQMINDSVNQTLSRTVLTSTTVWLVVMVLYAFGGNGVHLFAFVMVVGVLVGTYSSIYVASPLLLLFGEGHPEKRVGDRPAPIAPQTKPAPATA